MCHWIWLNFILCSEHSAVFTSFSICLSQIFFFFLTRCGWRCLGLSPVIRSGPYSTAPRHLIFSVFLHLLRYCHHLFCNKTFCCSSPRAPRPLLKQSNPPEWPNVPKRWKKKKPFTTTMLSRHDGTVLWWFYNKLQGDQEDLFLERKFQRLLYRYLPPDLLWDLQQCNLHLWKYVFNNIPYSEVAVQTRNWIEDMILFFKPDILELIYLVHDGGSRRIPSWREEVCCAYTAVETPGSWCVIGWSMRGGAKEGCVISGIMIHYNTFKDCDGNVIVEI